MKYRLILLSALAALLILLLGIIPPVHAQQVDLVVIGNPETVPKELNSQQLRSIMKGERLRWENSVSVKIALMKTNTDVGSATSERIYNMSANELNKYFLAMVFQGKVKAPMFFTSESELESYVARTPGAIGVLSSTINQSLPIVMIDENEIL
jgi:ABC-type phosphate transport system substrate-binding protein